MQTLTLNRISHHNTFYALWKNSKYLQFSLVFCIFYKTVWKIMQSFGCEDVDNLDAADLLLQVDVADKEKDLGVIKSSAVL